MNLNPNSCPQGLHISANHFFNSTDDFLIFQSNIIVIVISAFSDAAHASLRVWRAAHGQNKQQCGPDFMLIALSLTVMSLNVDHRVQEVEETQWKPIWLQTRGLIYQQCVEKVLYFVLRMKFRMCLSTKKSVFIKRAHTVLTHIIKQLLLINPTCA